MITGCSAVGSWKSSWEQSGCIKDTTQFVLVFCRIAVKVILGAVSEAKPIILSKKLDFKHFEVTHSYSTSTFLSSATFTFYHFRKFYTFAFSLCTRSLLTKCLHYRIINEVKLFFPIDFKAMTDLVWTTIKEKAGQSGQTS